MDEGAGTPEPLSPASIGAFATSSLLRTATTVESPDTGGHMSVSYALWVYKPFEQFGAAEWERILRVNLIGVFEATRQVLPIMRRAGRGRIVNMGSLAGKEGLPNLAAYSAASAGVIAFTKALSREVCETAIRVNCVAPGPIDTELIRSLGTQVVDEMISASPIRRRALQPSRLGRRA